MRTSSFVDDQEGGSALAWRKSSRSTHAGDCVEVAEFSERRVAVRDSKNPAGGAVFFTASDWTSFVAQLKNV